jgi:methyltransferase (TIGR00027 family)
MERTPWPAGDAAAEQRLAATFGDPAEFAARARENREGRDFGAFMVPRTRFFDRAVVDALTAGMTQVVTLGAGYDGRALRYRTPGVRFFEVDHPATQGDKLARLHEADVATDDITFVGADFTEPGLADTVRAAGFDATQPAQFLCEGVLRYLPEEWFHALLQSAAELAASGGRLAASISTREGEAGERERAREELLEAAGEAVYTVPPRGVALQWVADAGWSDVTVDPSSQMLEHRARLLVSARRD